MFQRSRIVWETMVRVGGVGCGILLSAGQELAASSSHSFDGASAQERAYALGVEDYREARAQAVSRQRRVIYNNDGVEVFLFPAGKEITSRNVLDLRTTALVGSQVDSIFYNAANPSFGMVSHYSKVFDVRGYYEQRHRVENKVNAAWPLIKQGKDSLDLMVQFCRENGIEIFLSKRMNDTHDAGRHRPTSPDPTFAPIKTRHPEYLFGSPHEPPPYGPWSAVDYGHPEVRELAYRYLEEVCQKYDVDGIELDFFRGPVIFKSVAWGASATQEERDLMTGLVRRIRKMTELEGRKRGRPILVALRAPDSVDYCQRIGLDLERWMEEGLIDLFIPAGLFRLNRWDYSVRLGRRHGVSVYPCLADPTWHDWEERNSIESYRARAMNAWGAGADGVYLFNMFQPDHPMLLEIGDPQTLAETEKLYFVSVRGASGSADPGRFLADAAGAFNYQVVAPNSPLSMRGAPLGLVIEVGEELQAAVNADLEPEVVLRLLVPGVVRPDELETRFNGRALSEARQVGHYVDYTLDPSEIFVGGNEVEVGLGAGGSGSFTWQGDPSAGGNGITFTRIEVTTVDKYNLRIGMSAAAHGEATIGSFSIRTPGTGETEPVPPGFEQASNGHYYPAGWTFPGLLPNGPRDEDPAEGTFAITLSMKDGKPGDYAVQLIAQNRPDAGPYYLDTYTVPFSIDEAGNLLPPRPLQDVQLRIRYGDRKRGQSGEKR